MGEVSLREVIGLDLPVFFEHQLDPESNRMAAFTPEDPSDRAAFDARWKRILEDEKITGRTILSGGEVVGHIGAFEQFGEMEVTYWIPPEHWGKGIATKALTRFLREVTCRPLYARAAKDNFGSLRVLEKCGFIITGEDRGFANARGKETEEYILRLDESGVLEP